MDKDGEKGNARSITVYQELGDILICSSNETTSGIAAAIRVPT